MNQQFYSIVITGTKTQVWQVLWDKTTFPMWANAIDEGMNYLGELKQGAMITFQSTENGYGVQSLVEVYEPNTRICFHHIMDTQAFGKETREAAWSGGRESYELEEQAGMTTLRVCMDVPPPFVSLFQERVTQALQIIKTLVEKNQSKKVGQDESNPA